MIIPTLFNHLYGGKQMAEKHNATCSICGRPYYKCISCRDAMTLNPWKALCCSSQHYKVHQVIKGQNSGVYTKDEARNKLKNIGISDIDIDGFKPNIKKIIEDILKEDKPLAEPAIKVSKEEIIEKPVYSRKRNYRANKVEADENVEV